MSTEKSIKELLENSQTKYNLLKKETDELEIFIKLLQKEIGDTSQVYSSSKVIQPYIGDVVYELLKNNNKSSHIEDIAKYLLEKGIKSSAKNFVNNIGSILHRQKRFKRLGQGMWALTEWDDYLLN